MPALTTLLDSYNARPSDVVRRKIDNTVWQLHAMLSNLPARDKPRSQHVQSFEVSLELFLQLLWPQGSSLSESDVANKAEELVQCMGEPKMRLCSAVYMTMWKFFVGAASAASPEVRTWFVYRLQKMLPLLGATTWEDAKRLMSMTLMPDTRALSRLKHVWDECGIAS